MKRPIGLILSAIALSLAAFFSILTTVLMMMAGIFADKHPPFIASAPGATPHFFLYLMLAVAVFYAMLAAWATLTVIGILRLRSWGRYSILIIGGGLAVLGLFAAVGTLVSHIMLPKLSAQQPTADPHILSAVFVALTFFYLLVSAVGVWWLIYFNLRAIRDLFSGARFQTPSSAGIPASPDLVPTPIKIVAVFLFIGAACCLLCLFLPFPAFFLGFILPLSATHVLYLAFAALAAFAGYGLLRLKESARLLTIAFLILGFCNVAMAALPWYQSRFQTYTAQIIRSMPSMPGQSQPPDVFSSISLLFSAFVGLILYGFIFWLLHRHRAAFKTPPPAEPMLEA
jgi:hypothetical protein